MSDLEHSDDKTWSRFFDYLYCDDPSREEVRERLRSAGIDVTPAVRRVQQALKASQARAQLDAARAARRPLLERMQGIVSPAAEQLREKLRSLINEQFSGSGQLAYFRKLEEAASEEDLRSMLDDLRRLEEFSEGE